MRKGLFAALFILGAFAILFGCTGPTPCGDNICNGNETYQTCPADCPAPVAPTLNVTVYDANTNLPIQGATVTAIISTPDPNNCAYDVQTTDKLIATTNSNGLGIINPEAGKRYAVFASADGYKESESFQCVTLKAGETQSIKLPLTPLPPKFMCPGTTGTQELAFNESVNVAGAGNYNGRTLQIEVGDVLLRSSNEPKEYGFNFLLKDNNLIITSIDTYYPANLRDALGTMYVGQDANYLGACWRSGEQFPRAIVVVGQKLSVTGTAVRTLPSSYTPRVPVSVSIDLKPFAGTTTWGLYESFPSDWNFVSAVCTDKATGLECSKSDVSYVPARGEIDWAAIGAENVLEEQERILTYTIVPPVGTTGTKTFSGSVDDYIVSTYHNYIITGAATISKSVDENAAHYGACVIRSETASLPLYIDPDLGPGYAKSKLGEVADYNEVLNKCNDVIFNALKTTYCSANSSRAQWQVALYSDKNKLTGVTTGCAASGCGYHVC